MLVIRAPIESPARFPFNSEMDDPGTRGQAEMGDEQLALTSDAPHPCSSPASPYRTRMARLDAT